MRPLALVRESFRFHRMGSQTLVRVLFICAYVLSALRRVFPSDLENLTELYQYLMTYPAAGLGFAAGQEPMPAISSGTITWAAVQFATSLFLLLFAIAYASLYVAEHEGDSVRLGLKRYLKSVPRLLAFFFMFFGISLLSSALTSVLVMLFLLIAGALTLYFLPLLLSRTHMKLMWAVNRSFTRTRGSRFYILNCLLLVTFIVSLARNTLLMVMPSNIWADAILGGFFTAAMTLMHGRLMGALYFIVFKQKDSLPGIEPKAAD